jgi:hypothetical protein
VANRVVVSLALPAVVCLQATAMIAPFAFSRGGAAGWGRVALVLGVVALAGAVLALIVFLVLGRVERSAQAKKDLAVERRAEAPWEADNRWDPEGISVSHAGAKRRRTAWDWAPYPLFLAAFAAGIVVQIGWLALLGGGGAVIWFIARGAHASGLGKAHLSFARFPFHPGERAEMTFGFEEGGASFEHVRYVLRRYVESPDGERGRGARCDAVAQIEFAPPEGLLPGPDQYVTLAFDIPADAGGTRLSARWPSYWELEVVGRTNRGPYRVLFLIPVYERPAVPSAT